MTAPVASTLRPAVSPRAAALLLAASILCLGINWPLMKLGLRDIGPLWFATIRLFLAGVCYAAMLLAQGRLAWPSRQDMPVVLGAGVLQMAALMGLVTFALRYVDAGRSSILIYTTSLWMVPGAVLILGEKASRWQLAGLALGLCGIGVLFNPLTFDWHSPTLLLGNGCLLLASVCWAAALLQVRTHRWRMDPLQVLPWQALLGTAVLTPFAIWQEGAPHLPLSPGFLLVLLYSVVPATCFSLWGLVTAARVLPAITVSIAQLATPVVGVIAAIVVLGESPAAAKLAGLACILTGVASASLGPYVSRSKSRQAARDAAA